MKAIEFPKDINPKLKDTGAVFHHSVDLQVRFNDADMLGHLNNTVYLSFMDLGKTRYFSDVMGGKIDWSHIGTVIVHIDCDFLAPTFIDEPLAVATTLLRMSVHSFTLEQRVYNKSTMQVKCAGTIVMAGFDHQTQRAIEIPKAWSDAFREFESQQ